MNNMNILPFINHMRCNNMPLPWEIRIPFFRVGKEY